MYSVPCEEVVQDVGAGAAGLDPGHHGADRLDAGSGGGVRGPALPDHRAQPQQRGKFIFGKLGKYFSSHSDEINSQSEV